MYKHPGVYVEHVPSGLLSIEAASTSIAAFIGPVKRGPVGEPVFISSTDQFANQFGDLGAGGGVRNEGQVADFFGHAVQAYFTNGGKQAYIVRVAEDGTGSEELNAASTAIPDPSDAARGFKVTAMNPGSWGDAMVVRLSHTDPSTTPDPELGYTFEVGIMSDGDFVALETFTGTQMAGDDPQSIESVVGDGSTLVNIEGDTLAEIGAVSSEGVTGDPLVYDEGTVKVEGRGVEVTVGGVNPVEVRFDANTADPGVIAQAIQDQVRAGNPNAPDFTVTSAIDGSDRILILRSGIIGAAGNVGVSGLTPSSESALTRLGLGAGASTSQMPAQDISGGGTIEAFLNGGSDGVPAPDLTEYQAVFNDLRDYRDISIMLLPGLSWIKGGDNSIIQSAITHAEFMQNRMVIVDPPDTSAIGDRLVTPKDVKDLGVSTSPYVALYYPWMTVTNGYYDPDTAANLPRTFTVPPSAFAAGMWARIDGRRGVWKAPAGLETTVRGAIGPNVNIGNDLQDNLNEFGVNCMRSIVGPTVIWGARTRATKTKPEFRYVPVRRTQSMIGESLYRALQAVVFEPNDHRLWASLRANVGAFMDTLHRAGAFQGEKASDAYFVKCNLGETMTQADIDAGVVRVVVGFAPLKPAEFVVVQIKQIVGLTA
jgi:phage tail sheath protein FI